jgi:hypothetical protein
MKSRLLGGGEPEPVPERQGGLQVALPGLEKHREKMDDADQGMEASAATIRDRIRRRNAVTLNHQQAIYTEKLRPSHSRQISVGADFIRADASLPKGHDL